MTRIENIIDTAKRYVEVGSLDKLGMSKSTAFDRVRWAQKLGILDAKSKTISSVKAAEALDAERQNKDVGEAVRSIVRAYQANDASVFRTAKALGKSERHVRHSLQLAKAAGLLLAAGQVARPQETSAKSPETKIDVALDPKSGNGSIETSSPNITSVQEALDAAKVDMKVWTAERNLVNFWDVTMRGVDGDPITVRNYQIKVWLTRRPVDYVETAFAAMTAAIDKVRRPLKAPTIKASQEYLFEISLFDHHFGKLAWGDETGQHYDLKIAERLYLDAVDDLLLKAKGFGVKRILYPIGQDFFHIDNAQSTTANGTAQDVDGRMAKVFECGCRAVLAAVDRCAGVAPVELLWVPGNHDRATSYYLMRFLAAWYRSVNHVTVDSSPKVRKYLHYGQNLIGYTHGDEEAHRDLPTIMASECPEEWSKTTYREWHLGHLHKKRETRFNAGDTYGAVVVRVLPSLSGIDAWHYRKGFVGGKRAAEGYLWHPQYGNEATLTTVVRDS